MITREPLNGFMYCMDVRITIMHKKVLVFVNNRVKMCQNETADHYIKREEGGVQAI